ALKCAAVSTLLRYDPKSTGFFGNTPEPVVIRQGLASQTRCPVEDVDHGGVRGHPDLRARVKHVLDAMVDESVQLVTALTGAEFGHGAVHDLSGPAFGNDTLLPELGFSASHDRVVHSTVLGGGDHQGAGFGAIGTQTLQGSRDDRGRSCGDRPVH